jgi:hypothetical protein
LFEAMLEPDRATNRKSDWWTAPVAGGKAEKAGVGDQLLRQRLSMLPKPGPPVWNGDALLFTARWGDTANLWQLAFSQRTRRVSGPAERLTFGAAREMYPSAAGAQSQWIPITDGQGLDRNAVFSADASLLYFLSERDGFRCIWAQRLDRQCRPRGAAFPVVHLHGAKRSLDTGATGAIGLTAAPGKLIFSMEPWR